MAKAGEVLENPATGERLVFRRTAAETGGEALEYELVFRPQGFAAQEHLHPRQQERHEVLEGALGIVVAGRERRLGPGDVEVVPPRTPHRIFPVGGEPVRAVFESRPALRSEQLLETLFALGREGKVDAKGNPHPLQLAVIGREFAAEGRPTKPPPAVQNVLLPPLAAIGRWRGYRAVYSGSETDTSGAAGEYVFLDEWDVAAPREAVFGAIADARTYPEWWRPVYISTEADGPPAVGVESRQHFKGRLPYTLKTRSRIVALDPPSRVEADVVGDLRGKGIWTLSERDGGTHVRFDWTVFADRPLIRRLTPVLRPLFRWNHNWAVARAREGLEPYARTRSGPARTGPGRP